jgi:hypothetical protein
MWTASPKTYAESARARDPAHLILRKGGHDGEIPLAGLLHATRRARIAETDLPDAKTAAAVSLAVNGVGAARLRTVVLLTPEEMDASAKLAVDYRPPGAAAK